MSQPAYEAIIPLHDYELRPAEATGPAQIALLCRRCGLHLAQWTQSPGLDVVIRTAREHELSAHPRTANATRAYRPEVKR